ncbi:hypothetical protein C8Q77DRAFT_1110450 [Trametes polyzona]|nr:hypothetical protein C8Q77DRAFT_1110450 [Trametes polyzona]
MRLTHNGFFAHISCEGNELDTYEVKKEDDTTMSCWIASEAGKRFSVHWGHESDPVTLRVSLKLDGRNTSNRVHNRSHEGYTDGVSVAASQRRPFLFTPLTLTDDEDVATSGVNEDLGEIVIKIRLVERWIQRQAERSYADVLEIGPVHEKSKKAGVHAVGFGDPEPYTARSGKINVPVGLNPDPIVVFKFRYRPLALLQANGIAPAPENPERGRKRASDRHDPLDDAGPSLAKRQRQDSQVAVVKDENDDDDDDDADDITFLREQLVMLQKRLADAEASRGARVAVKREGSPIRVPMSAGGSTEVIDLT